MTKLEFSRGEQIAQKYEVIDLLDESPLGVSYRVKHLKSGKFVRLLLLRPKVAGHEQKDRLIEIHKRMKALEHPGLVKVGELGDHEGVAYVTIEDFEGQTLRELITQYKVEGQRFALKEAAQVTLQILEALAALHDQGMVHRALRPEYVLINVKRTGPRNKNFVARVKLIGAGFWDLVPAGNLAEDEFGRGEAQYLAPEMKSFEPVATARSDVYSAGVVFYEMLVGSAPVGTFQLPGSVRNDLPKRVNDIVELALANAPEDRYQTAADFTADLTRTIQESEVQFDDRKPRVFTPVAIGLSVMFVLAVAIILYQLRPDPEREVQSAQATDTELRNELQGKQKLPTPEEVKAILALHPPNMVYVPAGPFIEGRLNYDPDSLPVEPLAKVTDNPKPFLIDAFEYPNLKGALAKYDVTWEEAGKLCQEQGKRLCSAQEWEKACKGPLNSIYGYDSVGPADAFDQEFCGDGLSTRGYKSGEKVRCKSGWGVYDMSGSFREWTASEVPGKDKRRIVKGGLARAAARGTRCAFTADESVSFSDSTLSFRCCRDVDAPAFVANPSDGSDAVADPTQNGPK